MAESLLFSDDTSTFYSHSDPKQPISVLNIALIDIDIWMKSNKRSLNIKKKQVILYLNQNKS